jgi:hypothetical protein
MYDFHQWLESKNLTVMGGNQPVAKAPEAAVTGKKPCKDCNGPMTNHRSGLCATCRKEALAALDAKEDRDAERLSHGVA